MPPKPTQEKRLSIQMGAVMVSFDMDGFQQEEVDEQELLCECSHVLAQI